VRDAIFEGIASLRLHDQSSSASAELDYFRRLLSQAPEGAARDHTRPTSIVMTRQHWQRLAQASRRAALVLGDRVLRLTPHTPYRRSIERAECQLKAFATEILVALGAPNTGVWRIRRGVHPNDSGP
jgi:hypothetical protein